MQKMVKVKKGIAKEIRANFVFPTVSFARKAGKTASWVHRLLRDIETGADFAITRVLRLSAILERPAVELIRK